MEYGYVLKISNKNLYREIQLSAEDKYIKIGLDTDCDVRFYKEQFFENFSLTFIKKNNKWQLMCSDNVFADVGDVRKLVTKELFHGDRFSVKYQSSDALLFEIEFLYDFDNEKKDYSRVVDISGRSNIVFSGNPSADIILESKYSSKDYIELVKCNDGFKLLIKASEYGVYVNGSKSANGAVIKNYDFFSVADYSFYIKNMQLYTSVNTRINGLAFVDVLQKNGYPKFNRNTRVMTVINDEKIEVLDPPAKPKKQKNNIITKLLPSLGMIAVGIGGVAFSPFMLISSGIGVVVGIVNYIQAKKEFKDNAAERIEKYNAYIDNKRREITEERLKEQAALEEIYIDSNVENQYFAHFSSHLFERSPEDGDFLCVRLGTGDTEAKKAVNFKKQERLEVEDDLQTKPEEISKEFKYVHNAPIFCDLKEINAFGIVGTESNRFGIMKNIVIDICARHFQSDVKLFFVAKAENRDKVYWLRMLPHVYNETIGVRNIVCDDESKNILFEYLYKELTLREQNKTKQPHIVVFLYDEYGFQNHPISKFVSKAKELGITFIFFGSTRADIGQGCGYIAELKDSGNGVLINTSDKSKSNDFIFTAVTDAQAENIVKLLAPVYTEELSLEGTLVKNISLFKLLNILTVDDIDLDANWNRSQVFKSMSAPIGVSKSGVVSLDLHDKAHGPHGLVAGTTGSGKSEILQTYILSMALLFHPYEVGFVIIDFKGGGMVNQFKNLPHLVGAITNIDGKEIDRSLKSIKAELKKRQRLFAEAEVNHIDKYIKKYKAGEVNEPLPHLILIVDEFAELKADQPEFMKELISAARIGRSLGVHLILATQKPSGQVDDQIWSNSRFKLCLKVQDQADSNEVLKSPLAAEIKEPGRAYLQVGNNEIFELFQSAYSGAPEKSDNSNVKEFTVYALADSGKRIPVYRQKKKKSGNGNRTQLEAIVNYVSEYASRSNLAKLPDICLPPLAERIDYSCKVDNLDSLCVPIGIYDDPDNQLQDVTGINIFGENTLIVGSSMSGKTNLLQLIIRGIADRYTVDEVNIYIIDFASMVLKNFESLNHVGGVVVSNEDEKLKNLFKLILGEIATRKEKLLSAGVSNYLSYKEAGNTDIPQIVLMIDNLTALNELYLQDDDTLLTICREGIAVGISVIVANSQTQGIGYRYMSNFASKVALFCNDSGEYSSVFDYCRMQIPSVAGRCIIEKDKQHYECQTYLAFEGEKEHERVDEMRKFVKEENEKNPKKKANIIPVIPDLLTSNYVDEQLSYFATNKYDLVVGLNYANVSPFVLNLAALGSITVSGKENSGRSNFIRYLVSAMEKRNSDSTEIYITDNISRKLASLQDCTCVKSYSIMADSVTETVKNIELELEKRYSTLMSGEDNVLDNSSLIILIINNSDALELISNDTEAFNAYKNITGRYKNLNVCVIVGDYPNTNISYSAPELMRNLRDERHFLYFDDIDAMKIIDLPLAVIRENKKPISVGDCYYIKENECAKIKSVHK